MKKLILTVAAIAGCTIAGFSQFTSSGYKEVKIGMPLNDLAGIAEGERTDEGIYMYYDDLVFELMADEDDRITAIISTDAKVRIKGVNSQLIGKSYSAVKSILGNKMSIVDIDETHTTEHEEVGVMYHYFHNPSDVEKASSIYLEFDPESRMLLQISTYQNP